jgi:hypothetical protein
MAKTKSKDFNKDQLRARIAELKHEGCTQEQIGNTLSITQQAVSYHLKSLKREAQERIYRNIDEPLAEALDNIVEVRQRCWQTVHYYQAAGPSVLAGPGAGEKDAQSKRMQALQTVLMATQHERALLGLDQRPKQVETSLRMTDDELLVCIKKLTNADTHDTAGGETSSATN